MNINLSELGFFEHYQSHTPFMAQIDSALFDKLKHLPFLYSLEDLLKLWPKSVQVHLPDLRDEISSIDTTASEARSYFDQGMGLLFNEAHDLSKDLEECLETMKKEMGLSALTYGRCLIYATPDGKGTAPHFDQNINFVLQIHGTKKWTIARNEDLENPLTRHTMGQMPDPEMMGYLEAPLPDTMPESVQSFELKPGSLLFVPRGAWHSTEAQGDALALNFTFTAPTWIDLFTAALRSRLSLSAEWRATADGVSDPKKRKIAQDKFDDLLGSLVLDLPNWRAEDILNATEPE